MSTFPSGIRATGIGMLAALIVLAGSATAAEFTVYMTSSYRFDPSYLEIEAGDTVTWFNQDFFEDHTSTSVNGYWDSPDLSYGDTFYVQFLSQGTYDYVDAYYYALGMTGRIVVKPSSQPVTPAGLADPKRLPDGSFEFTITNLSAGKTLVVEYASNLTNWISFLTNVPSSSTLTFTDLSVPTARRFYRCYQIP